MRIAHLVNPVQALPPTGDRGRWHLVTELIRAQIRAGHDITIVGRKQSALKGAKLLVVPATPTIEVGLLEAAHQAYKHQKQFDVIHSHLNTAHLQFTSTALTPTVVTQHWPITKATAKTYTAQRSARIIVVPISQAQTKNNPGILYSDVVYNGIDLKRFPLVRRPQKHLVCLGRLHPSKGIHHALRVCAKLHQPLQVAGFTSAQRQDYTTYWKNSIKPWLRYSFLKYKGELPHSVVGKYLGQAQALLFPIEWEEPFGLVMVEAMATGTPVIAYNRGAAPEIIQSGVTGFIVNNERELANAIGLVSQIDRRACRARVKRYFTIDQMVQGYNKVYATLHKRWR